jgi:5,10-methylenetetrahydromethanopterin reductase
LGLSLSNETPVAETVALAVQADKLGFSEVWLPESRHGRGVFTVAASVAARTERIDIGIGVVNPFWRHPSVIAMEAAALDEIARGRVLLGVGAALWTLRALGEADPRTERPLTAMVEALQVLRALLHPSEAQGVDGEIFPVRADAALDFVPRRRIPIYVGAVSQRMLQAAGRWADGVELGAMVSPGYVRWSWDRICEGAEEAGRDPATLDLASNVLVSVDRDPQAARDAVRRVLAYYTARVEPIVLRTSGADPDELAAVQQAVADHGVAAGAELVTDAMIDTFAAAGDTDQVATRLTEFAEAGLRGLNAWHVLGPEPQAALVVLARDVHDRVVAS